MGIADREGAPRRLCPVFFLLDTSGSMSGAPIGAVNSAMENVLPELASMNYSNSDAEIGVGVVSFNFSADWIPERAIKDPESFPWNALDALGGTNMGAAFDQLNDALSKSHGLMKRATGSVAPVLFLLSDGEPTDDWQPALERLKQNNWYKASIKVAIGYGESSNDAVLAEFTGTMENVIHTNDPNDLKRMIKFVAIRSSQVASDGTQAGPGGTQGEEKKDTNSEIGKIIKDELPEILAEDPNDDW